MAFQNPAMNFLSKVQGPQYTGRLMTTNRIDQQDEPIPNPTLQKGDNTGFPGNGPVTGLPPLEIPQLPPQMGPLGPAGGYNNGVGGMPTPSPFNPTNADQRIGMGTMRGPRFAGTRTGLMSINDAARPTGGNFNELNGPAMAGADFSAPIDQKGQSLPRNPNLPNPTKEPGGGRTTNTNPMTTRQRQVRGRKLMMF